MNYKKIIPFLILIFIGIFMQKAEAQGVNIKGDTIFVNAEAEYVIQFPTIPGNFTTDPIDAPYEVRGSESKIIIMAKAENTKPIPLKVFEGGRNHLFIIAFKKEINFDDPKTTFYDYGTVKKLEEHIRETEQHKSAATPSPVVKTEPVDNPLKYNELIEKGNKSIGLKNFGDAILSFEEANRLRPTDPVPLQKLDEIKKMQAGPDKPASKENDKKYLALTTDAKVYLDQKKYEQAREAFKQALEIRPGDPYATRQFDAVNKIILKQDALAAYDKYMAQGEKAINNNQFAEARTAFEQALVIKPNDYPASNRLRSLDKKEKDQKQREGIERNYNTAMEAGGRFFEAGDYISAKKEFTKANGIIPGSKPQEEIRKTNEAINKQAAQANAEKLRQQQEGQIESRYTTLLKNAEIEFDKSNYVQAKRFYTEASGLRPSEEYPKQRLLTIENILARIESDKKAKEDSIAQAKVETQREAQEADIIRRYTNLLKNAEIEFDKSNYTRATKLYIEASGMKPAEQYPKERLLTIENILVKNALEKETTRKYDDAVSKAKSSFQNKDLLNAKLSYEEATALKPSEEEPKNQLRIINEILVAEAKKREIDSNYNLKIAMADSQRNAKAYEPAIITYNEALSLKPSEQYPRTQINYIQATKYNEALKSGDKATADKRWNDAISAYTEALSIHPNNEYAQQRLKIVIHQGQLARTADSLKQASLNKEPVVPEKTKKQKRKERSETEDNKIVKKADTKPIEKNLESQTKPINYSNEELKTKYPEFDFSVLPPDQPFNQTAVYNKDKEVLQIYRTMVREKPRLSLNSSDQKIKLICEGINFLETNAYIKVLIQNYSDADFLTGAMMLTWTKMAGNRIKLYPNHLYPSPLPVIQPGHQAAVIYVFKTYAIKDEETLNFELNDRPKKVTLQIKIPGSTFNKELGRQK